MPIAFKPVEFKPYGGRRSRLSIPPWLTLLVIGLVIGAGGVVLIQEKYLPPRLSAADSTQLRQSLEQSEADRGRLQSALADTKRQLDAARAEHKALADEAATSRATIDKQRQELSALVAALPPDPRGGAIEVRAARFAVDGGALAYDVVLSRPRPDGKLLSGVMQVVVAAEPGAGKSVSLSPVAITVGQVETLRGTLPLPQGFKPQQATIQILDRVDGKRLGMRVMAVR